MEGSSTIFLSMPEGVISTILSLTSPKDTCRFAIAAPIFKLAAEADSVWEKFLPPDYQEIISQSVSPVYCFSKKQLYFRLCKPILIDGRTKSFWLDRSSGKKCYILNARHLRFTRGDEPVRHPRITGGRELQHREWKSMPESRFLEVARLTLRWLEIHGKFNTRILSQKKNYVAYLIVKFEKKWYGHYSTPFVVVVEIGNKVSTNLALLCPDHTEILKWPGTVDGEVRIPRCRADGWMEIELGDFYNDQGDDQVEISLRNGSCSCGLIIEGVETTIPFVTNLPKFWYLNSEEKKCELIERDIRVESIDLLCSCLPVSWAMKAVADSNIIWESFLPSDHEKLVSDSVFPIHFSSKKELYFRLCDPILIDMGKKSFSLEKSSGKKCYMLSARELSITWGSNPLYWSWKPIPQSRFPEAVELRTISWLEIHGKIRTSMLSPKTIYVACIVIKFADRAYGLDLIPSYISVELGDYKCISTTCLRSQQNPKEKLEHLCYQNRMQVLRSWVTEWDERVPQQRKDGWMEVELGEFFIKDGDEGEVKMSLMEIKGDHLKGGLIIEGIEVMPKL